MKRAVLFTLAILLLGAIFGFTLVWRELHTPSGDEDWMRFKLERGHVLTQVAANLYESGLISKPSLFILWSRLSGNAGRLQAGEYLLSPSMSPADILRRIVEGRIMTVNFTIPEGMQITQIAGLIHRHTGIDSAAFVSVCTDDALAQSLGVYGASLEGYLFPDTYTISPGTHPDRLAALMVSRLFTLVNGIEWDEELTGLSLHQILTLASIVEKETLLPEERPTVAAVYLNRLRIGMKLDADPTVIYALGGLGRRLTYEDLRFQSPYNTYLNVGLPPGPICSPGLGSIRAVVHPDRHCDALYFVARGDGSHVFSSTFTEHTRAVREYRRRSRGG